MKRWKAWLSLFILVMAAAVAARAEMPSTSRTKSEKSFTFGDIRIRQSFDSMKDPMSPVFTMQVFEKERLLLQLNDAAFDSFHAAPNGQAFVGLSNTGWPATAAIIFDRQGRILLMADHGTSNFRYCRSSPTMRQEWYDGKNPRVRFPPYDSGSSRVPGITLRDCRGQTIDLLDVVAIANRDKDATVRKSINVISGIR